MAGYSGTPLPKKLGITDQAIVALIGAPPDFRSTLGQLPPAVILLDDLGDAKAFDVILFFTTNAKDLKTRFPALVKKLRPAGGLWIAWPKRTSGVATDLSDNIVRETGLAAGLVDNKVCAIDETWSGLRFVIRLRDRPKKTGKQP